MVKGKIPYRHSRWVMVFRRGKEVWKVVNGSGRYKIEEYSEFKSGTNFGKMVSESSCRVIESEVDNFFESQKCVIEEISLSSIVNNSRWS